MKWLYAYVQGFPLPWLINLETLPQLFRLVRLLKKSPFNKGGLFWPKPVPPFEKGGLGGI